MSAQESTSRVAIGMPVYNGADYLAETVAAVQAQTLADWTLVISDNASTDSTVEVARALADDDGRIVVLETEANRGQADNFRRSFEATSSPLFMWLSHDDLLESDYLERCVSALDQDPGLVAAYTEACEIDGDGSVTGPFVDGPRSEDRASQDPAVRLRESVMAEPALSLFAVHRRAELAGTGLFGHFVGSDRVLAGKIALVGPVRQLPGVSFRRRTHVSSFSHSIHTNRKRFISYCGRAPSRLRPLAVERIWRLADAVRSAELSRDERRRCYLVVLGPFARFTLTSQVLLWLRATSQVASRLTGREVQLHRLAVTAAKRLRDLPARFS